VFASRTVDRTWKTRNHKSQFLVKIETWESGSSKELHPVRPEHRPPKQNNVQSNLNRREVKKARKFPAYRLITLKAAHSACKTDQNAQKTSRFTGFLPFKAVPLIEVRLYHANQVLGRKEACESASQKSRILNNSSWASKAN
jgi:hypothetical protein